MAVLLSHPRCTRSRLNQLAAAAALTPNVIYRITDEDGRIAIANTNNSYSTFAKESEAGGSMSPATVSQVRAGSGSGAITADLLSQASAMVTLTPSSIDWSSFIVGEIVLSSSSSLANPSNVIPGTTRYLFVRGSTSSRSLFFSSSYKGQNDTLSDVSISKWYLLTLVAYSSTHIVVSAIEAT